MPKLNIIIKIIILLLAAVLASGAIVFRLKEKIETGAKKIYEKQNMLAAIEKRDNNISNLKVDYEIVKKKMPLVKNILPDEDNIGAVIDALEVLAIRTNNSQVLNFEPSSKAENLEAIKNINYSAVLTGNSGSFVLYFEEIKKLPYLIEIGGISIANSSGLSNNNSRLNYNAKIFIKND